MSVRLCRGIFTGTTGLAGVKLLETERDVLEHLGRLAPLMVTHGNLSAWVGELCKAREETIIHLEAKSRLSHLPLDLRAFVATLPWRRGDDSGLLWELLHQEKATAIARAAEEFAAECAVWPDEFRRSTSKLKWIVPSSALVTSRDLVIIDQDVLRRADQKLSKRAHQGLIADLMELDCSLWLPALSLQLVMHASRIQKSRAHLEQLLRLTLLHWRSKEPWEPWSEDFPTLLRSLPVSWLYQTEQNSRTARLVGFLRDCELTHIGHLVIHHPGCLKALNLLSVHHWTTLFRVLIDVAGDSGATQ